MVPTAEKFDLVIVGGGPGGYAAALYGASAGLSIALVEKNKMGGTCLHVGCIPAKELLETAAVYRTVSGAAEFGIQAGAPTVDFSVTQVRKQRVIDQLTSGLVGLLKSRKVTTYDGIGRLTGPNTVAVSGGASGDVEITGDAVLLATGSVPRTIPGFDVDGDLVVTSDELLSLQTLPASAVVIGGGAIGCEFASTMSRHGHRRSPILEALPKILPGCDEDVTKSRRSSSFKPSGASTCPHGRPRHRSHPGRRAWRRPHHRPVRRRRDRSTSTSSWCRSAAGPTPTTLGLDGTMRDAVSDRGFVEVDERCRTGEPGVWAVGDVHRHTRSSPTSPSPRASSVVKDDPRRGAASRSTTPTSRGAIYCHPEVAFAGLSEQAAKDAGYDVVTSKHRYDRQRPGHDRGRHRGPGEDHRREAGPTAPGVASSVSTWSGPWVTEQLGQGYLAVNWEATVDEVAAFIQPHPSLSELFGETVLSLTGRSLHG